MSLVYDKAMLCFSFWSKQKDVRNSMTSGSDVERRKSERAGATEPIKSHHLQRLGTHQDGVEVIRRHLPHFSGYHD